METDPRSNPSPLISPDQSRDWSSQRGTTVKLAHQFSTGGVSVMASTTCTHPLGDTHHQLSLHRIPPRHTTSPLNAAVVEMHSSNFAFSIFRIKVSYISSESHLGLALQSKFAVRRTCLLREWVCLMSDRRCSESSAAAGGAERHKSGEDK